MMRRLVYTISLLLLSGFSGIYAQEDPFAQVIDTTAEVDSISAQDSFSIELSADYGKLIESLASNQNKWEFGLSFILREKFALVGEYGYGKLLPESVIQNGVYESEGNYFRAGAEYNFTIAPKRYLALGGMFATSTFSDYGLVQISSELWQDVNEEFSRQNQSASWAELILNTQGPIVNAEDGFLSNLYWGMRFRLRIMITDLERDDFDIYAIPGYGKTYSNVVPATNLFIRYRFNL